MCSLRAHVVVSRPSNWTNFVNGDIGGLRGSIRIVISDITLIEETVGNPITYRYWKSGIYQECIKTPGAPTVKKSIREIAFLRGG